MQQPPPSVRPRRWRLARPRRGAALGAALGFAAGPIAWAVGAPGPAVLAATLAGLFLAAWLVRPWAAELAGPLFFHDLVRLARRGRSTLLRCTYALLLLGGLFGVYALRFPSQPLLARPFDPVPDIPLHDLAVFAGNFATAVLALQAAAMLVLTPAYVARAIGEERERRTLSLLFTTPLSDREILLGKLFGRLTHLAGILLAGLPVLCLLQLWGGVEPAVLLAGFAVTGLTLLSVGGISILCSVLTRDSVQALVTSYAIVLAAGLVSLIPGCFFASPLGFLLTLEHLLGTGALHEFVWGRVAPSGSAAAPGDPAPLAAGLVVVYALIHGVVALLCILAAVQSLRGGPPQYESPHLKVSRVGGADPVEVDRPMPAAGVGRRSVHYPVTDPPLLWKEAYHGASVSAGWPFWAVYAFVTGLGLCLLLFSLLLVGVIAWASASWWLLEEALALVRNGLNPTVRVLGIVVAATWCLAVAWRASGSISRERDQRTLDGLLTLPVRREAILEAKWWGGILRTRWLGSCLAALWTLGLVSGALHPAAVLLLAAACAVHLAFLASLGVCLSLVSRNTLWANLSIALVLLWMFAGPWLAFISSDALVGSGADGQGWWDSFADVGLNPVRAWWYLGFTWKEFADEGCSGDPLRRTPGAALAGLALYVTAAGALWALACRRFRAEGGRSGGAGA